MKMETKIRWRGVIDCPACGSRKKHWYWQLKWGDLTITFWICECGLVYADRVPHDEELNKYYNEYYTPLVFGHHGLKKLRAHELQRATRIVWEQFEFSEVERHLDVGCGYGLLMQEVQDKYDCVSEGLDVRDLASNYGYKVYTDAGEIEGTYDLVTVIHTLEHVVDPVGFLKALRPLCSKNLFIEVPSFRPAAGILSPHHLFGFTTHSLADVAERAGFSIIRTSQIVHQVEIDEEDGLPKGKVELQLWAEVKDE